MFDSKNLRLGSGRYLLGLMLLFLISAICAAFITGADDFDISRREVLLRRIGHELLLQSGDSKSRVLPVKKISENEFQISFENQLVFQSNSLVNITRGLLGKDPLTSDYVVSVGYKDKPGVAYGYAISKNKKDDIITCNGRTQPRAQYVINVKFKPEGINFKKSSYVMSSLSFLALVGFVYLRRGKPQQGGSFNKHTTGLITLGLLSFDVTNRELMTDDITVDLTETECRLLLIFAQSPNEIIARSRLQKEIWEDQGIIVGRSLDMFISKLRKKLEIDPNIKITVVRGKGYKLEISS